MSTQLPDIRTQFPEWYIDVVYKAELADQAPVRGCMVVRPYGYAIWEHMQRILDARIKDMGAQNAAFPLLIPQSFLQREAEHVEGFSPELAVVTHAGGKELEEALVVRPTSETIIHDCFSRWMRSWRDLPLKVNQWCSVVRWEKRPRPFLRTTEFWWQEGHTAHETEQEAQEQARAAHEMYTTFMQEELAIPVLAFPKPAHERFAGADITLTMEAMMQDGKALQMGTSHQISQSFAKAFNMMFQDREGKQAYPYLTSWGVTTRMIGATIMVHGDQKGLILPPAIAPHQVVIVPIFKADTKDAVLQSAHEVATLLKHAGIRVIIDEREHESPGAKYYHWELRGVPFRLELGPRDIAQRVCVIAHRLTGAKESVSWDALSAHMSIAMKELRDALYQRALAFRDAHMHRAEKLVDFGPRMAEHNGFYITGWSGDMDALEALKGYQGTVRCVLPSHDMKECFYSSKPSKFDIVVAKAY